MEPSRVLSTLSLIHISNGIFKGRGRRRIPGAIAPDRLNGKGLPPHHPDACGLKVALAAQVGAGGAGFIDANPDGMDPKLAAMADGAQKAADAYDLSLIHI